MKFRSIFYLLTGLLFYTGVYGQGLIQAGGHIVLSKAPAVVIDGSQGHYFDTLGGVISVIDTGTIFVPGDWTNSSGTPVFSKNGGCVVLTGNDQYVKGSDLTAFPTLDLQGTGDKHLQINTLVGGGYSAGGNGRLKCNNHNLFLTSNRLIINNIDSDAITETGGGIISESDYSTGYGEVQWNIRNQVSDFIIPFKTVGGMSIPHTIALTTGGVSTLDSGYFITATYPTDPTATPNNRAMPNGVANTNNEFGRENASKLLDRYWIVTVDGFSSEPDGNHVLGYIDGEWDVVAGSTNDITEQNLRPVLYNQSTNSWQYPGSGATNVSQNRSTGANGKLSGIWTLSDTTVCPNALYSWDGNCEGSLITFYDESTIDPGSIESWEWSFGDGASATTADAGHTYSSAAVYATRLIVVGNSGCPDTLIKDVQIDARAVADFTVDDDPLVGFPVKFTEMGQNASDWLWDFGDFMGGTGATINHTYEDEGVFDVVLIANNLADCPDTVVKQVEVNQPSLFLVPDAFTPGGFDELNRKIGLVTLQRVSDFTFRVYNRWGELIYETNDPALKWDGTYRETPCPMGSYLYTMEFRDRKFRKHQLNGSFLLLR